MPTLGPLPTIPEATADGANRLRWALAHRRDALVGRQRRNFSRARQKIIDDLAREYDVVYGILLREEKGLVR